MSKPYKQRQAAYNYAFANIPVAKELAARFKMSIHAATKVLTEARGEVERLEPERLERHYQLLQMAREEARQGEYDARKLAKKIGITEGQAELVILITVKHAQKTAARHRSKREPEVIKPIAKPVQYRRIVRRFRDLSGTDATSDRVRYPSGVGFGVVEVVR